MKMEQIECSETSAYIIQTPGKHFIPPAYEDGTDTVFRNVGIYNLDAGELPKRKHNTHHPNYNRNHQLMLYRKKKLLIDMRSVYITQYNSLRRI